MRKILFILAALAVVMPLRAESQPQPARPAQKQEKEKERPETDVEKAMDKMAGAFRKLRRQAKEGQFGSGATELVATMKAASAEAQAHEPLKAAELPEAERVRFLAAFRAKMDEFASALDKLAVALKEGRTDDAAALVEKLGKLQRNGHEEFQPKGY